MSRLVDIDWAAARKAAGDGLRETGCRKQAINKLWETGRSGWQMRGDESCQMQKNSMKKQ